MIAEKGFTALLFKQKRTESKRIRKALHTGLPFTVRLDEASELGEYARLIDAGKYDVILIEDTQSGVPFGEAARLAQSHGCTAPLLCLCESIGEEDAASRIKQGACDLVHLSRLERLGACVRQAIEGAHDMEQTTPSAPCDVCANGDQRNCSITKINELLEEAQSIAHIGTWETDYTTNELFWSDEAYRIFGVDRDTFALDTDSVMALRHPDDRESAADVIHESLCGKSYSEYNYRIIRPNGELRYIHATRKMFYDESKKPVRGIGIIQDVTDQRLAELEMVRIKQNLEEAQSIAHIGSWERVLATNKILWSDEAYRIYGLDPKECTIDYDKLRSLQHPDDRDTVSRIQKETDTGNDFMEYEYRIIRPDGSIRHLHVTRRIFCDGSGKPVRAVGTTQDITERVLLEQKAKLYANFERAITLLAQDFINMPLSRMEDAIKNAMRLISEFCDMDRVAIYRYDFEREIASELYVMDNRADSKSEKLAIPFTNIKDALQCHLEAKEYSHIRKSTTDGQQRLEDALKSVYSAPMFDQDKLWGAVTMTSAKREEELSMMDSAIVKIFSEMIINVLGRIERDKALQEAYESNRLILDSINDGMGLCDRNGIVLNANDPLAQRFDTTLEQFIGTKMEQHITKEHYGSLYENWILRLRGVFDTGLPDSFVTEWGEHTLSIRFFPVRKDGEITAVAMFSTDITDSVKAQEEAFKNALLQRESEIFKQKEQEYLEILDAANDGAWTQDFRSGETTYSDKWIRRRGFERVQPKNLEKSGMRLIHPEDADVCRLAWDACLQNHRSMYEYEHRSKGRDGRYEWIHSRVKVIYDENGNPSRLYGACMNVDDRKHTEEALRRSESLLRNIIEGARNPIFLKDTQSNMVLCNSALANLFGQNVADIIGKPSTVYMGNQKKAKQIMENDRRMLEAQIPMTFEELIPTIYGDRTFLAEKTPLKDASGSIIGLIGVSQDITEQKNTEAELRLITKDLMTKNKLITDFIANISHELKTPLTIILMQMELMRLYLDDPENLSGMVDAATQNAIRLSRLVGNILDLSRADAGYLERRLDNVDIIGHVRDICESVRIYAQSKSIDLSFESEQPHKIMLVDVEKVERIILNLLSNAIKFTPVGGHIRVSASFRKNGDLVLMVQDTGMGISAEKLRTIFDRFVKVDTSLSRENEGCGIGLALVKSFVEVLDGNISVRSEIGKGSLFQVELPQLDSGEEQGNTR